MNSTDRATETRLPQAEKHAHLRVLFISHAYVVGVNQGKLNAIAETGQATVGLLAPSNWKASEWNRLLPLENPYPTIQLYSAPVLFSGRGGAHLYAPWKLWQVLNDFQPDIVQVEEEVFSSSTFEIALWSRLTGIPIVVFGWENMARILPLPRRKICQFVLNTASAIIPGNVDGAKVMQDWGYTGLLEVMPQMGVDPQFFAPRPAPSTEARPFQIGFLGRLAHSKGIDLIFAAAQQLRQRGKVCQIVICGSGAEEAALKQTAQDLQIADCIVWRGAVRHEQAPDELSQFDVLVLSSRTTEGWKEQFGHVLIEAMAMGIPVIGSSSGEIPNVIGRPDLVFPEEDAEGLAAILERMITEPTWRQDAALYGMKRVNQLYTHEQIANRLLALWQTVLTQRLGV